NTTVIKFAKVEAQLVLYASSQKFKILTIPNVLGHGKSYEHSFMKKYDGYKLCMKLRFDRVFMNHIGNSK
ncbi:hypothetical protein B296_00014247, partial [Ensete ventricosum]